MINSPKIKLVGIIAALFLLNSCGGDNSKTVRTAKGGVEYGHVFRVNEVSDVRSLHPLEITESTGFQIASQVYQGLVKFNQQTLEVEPCLAERWEVNETATEWTFHLRKGIKFHDDPCFPDTTGREITAKDVKWCMEQLCSPSPRNQMFWLVEDRLKGASDYYNAVKEGNSEGLSLAGVEVIDNHTVKFKLEFPFAGFLQIVGHNGLFIYPQEAEEHYGQDLRTTAVGTGPFYLEVFKPGENVVLKRSEDYWEQDKFGNQLPYLDAIQVSFIKDKKSELLKFKKGELDMVFTLPIEMYSEVMAGLTNAQAGGGQDFEPQVKPSMSVHYYAFQHKHDVFKDVRVRKAFNLAVDRESLVNHTLQGEGTPGFYGIVPPAFPRYEYRKLPKTPFDPEQARQLLSDAGYPDGNGFPELTLELASGGTNNELVAQVVSSMLEKNLGIKLNLQILPMAQLLDNSESGKAAIWRDGWIADYPDPENFLRMFVSNDPNQGTDERAYLNSVRYSNPLYDSLYHQAVRELDDKKRFDLYRTMDHLLMQDAVVMPLFYEEFTRLIPSRVRNFPQNSIEYRDFTRVWIASEKNEA